MSDNFYRAFEEKLRGSRDLIKQRLAVYIPFIQPLAIICPIAKALDLGCGRGEWIELLGEHGIDAKGIDIDEGMLNVCRERGLDVETADAVSYLQNLPDASLCAISGFHIAEHLPFEALKQIIQQAKRTLVPGGLLILETPNPENITVGTCNFYLDPTHQRPIPPLLLRFLPEHYGFARIKILRLQENPNLLYGEDQIKLMHVLGGVSPDYAVIAQNYGTPSQMELLDQVFEVNYGITLDNLAERFQQELDVRLARIEAKAHQANLQAQQAQSQAREYGERLHAVYSSRSWRFTASMRWATHQWYQLRKDGLKMRLAVLGKKFLRKLIYVIVARPALKAWGIHLAYQIGLGNRLKLYIQRMLYPQVSLTQSSQIAKELQASGMANLSPMARKIYVDLMAAVSKYKKESH